MLILPIAYTSIPPKANKLPNGLDSGRRGQFHVVLNSLFSNIYFKNLCLLLLLYHQEYKKNN